MKNIDIDLTFSAQDLEDMITYWLEENEGSKHQELDALTDVMAEMSEVLEEALSTHMMDLKRMITEVNQRMTEEKI